MRKPTRKWILFICGVIYMTVLSQYAPAALTGETVETAETVGGQLKIVKEDELQFNVYFNGKPIIEGEDFLRLFIRTKFPESGRARIVLLELDTGGTGCPAYFRIFEVNDGGLVSISDHFGNCSDEPTIQFDGKSLLIGFPPFGHTAREIWSYRNGKLSPVVPGGYAD
jgi:hypothetical protein